MQNKKGDQLFQLIKSLNKNEKRFFTLYSKLFNQNKTPHYLQLYKVMDKMVKYDPAELSKQIKVIVPSKHVNQLKRYLKVHLLEALKLYNQHNLKLIKQFDQISNARILLERNFIEEAQKILQTQKKQAMTDGNFILSHYINIELMDSELYRGLSYAEDYQKIEDYHDQSIELIDKQLEVTKLQHILIKVRLIKKSKDKTAKNIKQELTKIVEEELLIINIEEFKTTNAKDIFNEIYSIINSTLEKS